MNLDIFNFSCAHCITPHDLKTEPRFGMEFYCNSCKRLNRIKRYGYKNGKIDLVTEVIEDDEFRL
jgi:hypothetical protein